MKNVYHRAGSGRHPIALCFIILCGLALPIQWAAAAADPATIDMESPSSSVPTTTAKADVGGEPADEVDWARHVVESYREYAAQQEKTLALMEQVRQDTATAAAAATQSASSVEERLTRIESALSSDRERQVEALQQSQQFTLVMLGLFAALGLLGVLIMGLVLLRAVNRRPEFAGERIAPYSAGGLPLGDGPVDGATPAELSGARFLEAVQRLETRIASMEYGGPVLAETAALPGTRAAASATGGDDPTPSVTEGDHEHRPPAAWRTTTNSSLADLLGQGQSYLNLEQFDEAAGCFREVLAQEPDNAEAHVKLGSVLEAQNRIDEAMQHYDRAIDIDRSMTMAYLRKGGVFNRLERYGEALECYEAALRTQKSADLSPTADA